MRDRPCQLVWQVKEFGVLEGLQLPDLDPCQLAWQVMEFEGC